MKKKTVALLLALVMVFGAAVGGTIAWLTATTAEVKNTFTVGNIDIDLDESDDLDLKMVPGKDITKDPEVTVKANSEACWLFVKIDKSSNLKDFISYTVDSGWTQLKDKDGNDVAGVYYRSVDAATAAAGVTYSVLKDDQVAVLDTVTKGMMDAIEDGTATAPTLTFTACAVQSAGLTTATAAYEQAPAAFKA